jgi:hypothetical protein
MTQKWKKLCSHLYNKKYLLWNLGSQSSTDECNPQDTTPCTNTGVYFVGTCCFHHQSSPWNSRTVLLRTLIRLVLQVPWEMKFWQPVTLVSTAEDILWMWAIIFATDPLPWWNTTLGSIRPSVCVLAHHSITMLSLQRMEKSAIMIQFSFMHAPLEPWYEFQCNSQNE